MESTENAKIELLPGEEVCPKCNGGVKQNNIDVSDAENDIFSICSRCQGNKKLDWIEMAMGKSTTRSVLVCVRKANATPIKTFTIETGITLGTDNVSSFWKQLRK